jgi:hypothetical protein
LSPAALPGQRSRRGGRTSCIRRSNCVDSCACPAVTQAARGTPAPSETRCSFDPHPPRERPSAWSSGSPARSFRRARRRARRPHARAVDAPQVPVDLALAVEADAERLGDPVEGAVPAPPVEPVVDALSAAQALGQVTPGRPGPQDPQHAAEGGAVVVPSATSGLSLPQPTRFPEAPCYSGFLSFRYRGNWSD